jgi:uncharacterized protein (DUF2252 family)
MVSVADRILGMNPEARQQSVVDVLISSYGNLMSADPVAWRGKFRKMSASPFSFYRGSAALYYADIADDADPFLNDQTSRVWIQGDLHAENFGTYMNGAGVLVFDVNDFDEAYVAPFTWDLKRLAASLALIGVSKAMSDAEIREMIATVARAYIMRVAQFAQLPATREFALTLENTTGKLLEVLQRARLKTRVGLLEEITHIEAFDRRLTRDSNATSLDDTTQKKVTAAFDQYLQTIPPGKRFGKVSYCIKDMVARRGMGIGSAGLPSFNILVEGPTQALENDIIIYMKQAQVAAPSRRIQDKRVSDYFLHDGHRTVISQRALQAYADPWLGYTTYDGVGQLVAEVSPYEGDLNWSDIDSFEEILLVLKYLGQATAKIHCVSDVDSDNTLVPFSVDAAIFESVKGREDAFAKMLVDFGENYGQVVRRDYELFVDAFRNHRFPGL